MRSFIFAVLFFASLGAEPVTLDAFVLAETDAAIQVHYDRVGPDHP